MAAEVASLGDLPELGAGIAYRAAFRGDLFLHKDAIGFLEVTADHFFGNTADLDLLARNFRLVPHSLDLSLGSADGLDEEYLDTLGVLIDRIRPPWWSEHIAFTRAGGVSIGHLASLPHTREAVDVFRRNVDRARRRIGVPLILENITSQVRLPGAEMSESAFISRILDETGCGLLLDLTNLHTNSINFGFDPLRWLDSIPCDRIVQLHVAGGHWSNGSLIDSHSRAVPNAVWSLVEAACQRAQVKAACIERDENLPHFPELRAEIDRLRRCGRWN